jgi:hypothetical protein
MEIEAIIGNEEKVINIEKYYVIEAVIDGQVIEWKYDRRQPKIGVKEDGYA